MSGLNDYIVVSDKFEPSVKGNGFAFPCNVCVHNTKDQESDPCRTCGHNANAIDSGKS